MYIREDETTIEGYDPHYHDRSTVECLDTVLLAGLQEGNSEEQKERLQRTVAFIADQLTIAGVCDLKDTLNAFDIDTKYIED